MLECLRKSKGLEVVWKTHGEIMLQIGSLAKQWSDDVIQVINIKDIQCEFCRSEASHSESNFLIDSLEFVVSPFRRTVYFVIILIWEMKQQTI